MQIYGPSQVHGAQHVQGPHATRSLEQAAKPETQGVGDRLDISEAGRIASQMAEVPDIRADRVESLRAAILEGTYETEDKLDLAVERLLDEIA
ncbi:MAG: flagellar biosynthesis anti-sigma factor FlgM [Planctomycetota bacterium]|nr:MAG: flagellar biosynthesis anti-sigma factor FlgM [Planctomycetota bacterium]